MKPNNLQNSIWQHWKTHNLYKIVAYRKYFIESTGKPAIVYTRVDGSDKRKWVRPYAEFMDGRFKRVL